MASRLTPLTKGIIGAVLFGGMAYGYMHLKKNGTIPASPEAAEAANNASGGGEAFPALGGGGGGNKAFLSDVGTMANPLTVSLVEFQGYAGLLAANGGSLVTQPGSIMAEKGVYVKAILQNDVPALPALFGSGIAHCAWRTSDFWAQEQPNVRTAGFDGRGIVIVDNTQGADAIIAKDPAIRSVEDLAGHTVGLLEFTPSHGLLLYALENSSLSARKQASVKVIPTNIDEGLAGVRAQLESSNVDAVVLWDPELSVALETIPGAHVVYSTKDASSLIYDVMVCDNRIVSDKANDDVLTAFVDGWLEGNKRVNANPKLGTQALVANEEMYKLLAGKKSPEFITHLFKNLVLTNLTDNVRILGLAGDTNQYENVYAMFDRIYRGTKRTLKDQNAPIIQPSNSFEYKYIKRLQAKDSSVTAAAQKPEFVFTASEAQVAAKKAPVLTKPVEINFATNSTELTKDGENVIDNDLMPILQSNSSAYVRVSGNTDSTGSAAVNHRISYGRANVVVKYMVEQWGISHDRFLVEGNGPDKPLCNELSPEDGLSLEQCRARNRTTRVAVLPRE